ncbi:conserved Plasmodium protein, unknown function [Plasmodium vivax]|uniref:WD repeat-containing protein n=1 Tax=Plasmodium vivax TaxID=5855 RepID=A0A1G4H0J2_PLAVI|nr:conserved Plasmodium protein, unknown function [Plasmodium vivax]
MKAQEINGHIIAQGNYTRRAFQTNNIKIKTSSIVSTIESVQPKSTNLLTLNENLISKIRSDGLEIIKKEGEILDVNSKNVCYALKNGKFRLINQNGINTTRIKLPYDNEVVYVTFNKENGNCLLLLDVKGHLYVYRINEYKVELILCLNFPPYQKKSSSWTSLSSSNNVGVANTLKSGFPLKASWLPKSENFFLTGHNNCLYIWNISLLTNVMAANKWKDEVDVTDQLVAGCAVTLPFEPIMRRYSYVAAKGDGSQSGGEAGNPSHAADEKTRLNTYCMSLNGKYLLALLNNRYAVIWELQRSGPGISFTLVGFSSLQRELQRVKATLQGGDGAAEERSADHSVDHPTDHSADHLADHSVTLPPSGANTQSCADVEISSVHILNSFFQANEGGEGANQSTYYLLVFHSACCISVFPFNNKSGPSGGDTTERIDILRECSVQNIFVERNHVNIENIELFVDPSEFFVFFNISYRTGASNSADNSRSLIFIFEIFNKKRLDFKIHPKYLHLPNDTILPLCSIRLIKTNDCLKFSKVLNVSVSSSSLNIINLFMFSIIVNSSKKSVSVQSFSAPIPLLMGDVCGGGGGEGSPEGEKREGEADNEEAKREEEPNSEEAKREEEPNSEEAKREEEPNSEEAKREEEPNNGAAPSASPPSAHPGGKTQPDGIQTEKEQTVNIQNNIAHYEEFLNAIMTTGVGSQQTPGAGTGRGAITGLLENANGGHQSQREVTTLPGGSSGDALQPMSKSEMAFLASIKRRGVDAGVTEEGGVTVGASTAIYNATAEEANLRSDEGRVSVRERLGDLLGRGSSDGEEAAQGTQAPHTPHTPHAAHLAEEGADAAKNQLAGHPEMEQVNVPTGEGHTGEPLEMARKVLEGGRDASIVRGTIVRGANLHVEETPPQSANRVIEMPTKEVVEKLEEVASTKKPAPTTSHRSSRNEEHTNSLFFSPVEGGSSAAPQGEANQIAADIPLFPHAEAKAEVNEQEEKKTVEHNSNIDIIMSTHEDALRRFMECEDGGEPSEVDHQEKSDEENIPKVDTQHSVTDGEVAAEKVPLEEDTQQNEVGLKKEKNLNSFLHKLGFFKSSPSTVSNANQGDPLNEGKDETEKEKQPEVSPPKGKKKSDECSEVCEIGGRQHLTSDPTEGGTTMMGKETKRMAKKEGSEMTGLNKCPNKEREAVSVKEALSSSSPVNTTVEERTGKIPDDVLKQMCREICRKVSDKMADIVYEEIRSSGLAPPTKEQHHLEGSTHRGGVKSFDEMAASVSNCNRRMNELVEEMAMLRNGSKSMSGKILLIGTTVGKIYDALKGGGSHIGGVGCASCGGGQGGLPCGQKASGYEAKVEKLISEMSAFKKNMNSVTSKLSETLSCMSEDLKSAFAKSLKGNNEQLKRWALHDVRHGRKEEEGEAHQMGVLTENGVDHHVDHDRATIQTGKKNTPPLNKDMADFFNSAHQNAVKKVMPAVISSEIQIQFAKSVIPGMKEAYNTGFQSMKESLNSLLVENREWLSKELYAIEKAVLCEKGGGAKRDDALISISNKLEELQSEMKLFTFNMHKQISYLREDINGIGKARMEELPDGGELDRAMLREGGEEAEEEEEEEEEEEAEEGGEEEEDEASSAPEEELGPLNEQHGDHRRDHRRTPSGARQHALPNQSSVDDTQNRSSSSIAELKQEEDYPPKPRNDTSDILIKGRINHLLSEREVNQAFTLALSIDIERNTNAYWLLQLCHRFNVKHLLSERMSLTQPVLLGIGKILCESFIKTPNLTMEEADFRMKWVQECLQELDVNHSDLVKTNSYIFVKNMVNNISAFSYLVGKEIGKLNDSVVNLANLDLNKRILLNEDPQLREKKMAGRSAVEETEALASRNLYMGSPQKYYLYNKNMLVALQERLMLIRKLLKSIIASLGTNEDAPMCSR